MRTMVVLATIVFGLSCENGGVELKDDFALNIVIEDITETSAKVKVTHNGEKSDSWYGLLTTDLTTEPAELAKSAVKAYLMGENRDARHVSNRYIEPLENLIPGTEYRYIAFGLTAEGKSFGKVSSATFSTLNYGNVDTELMQYNSSWLVQYTGAGTLYEQQYDHIVSVLSNDQNPYLITVVEADKYNPEGLVQLANDLRDAVKEYLAYYNAQNGTAYRFADMLYTGNGADAFELEAGSYRAVVMGYSYTGEVSGLYAVSEPFVAKMPIASEAYNSWLGTWTITGANNVESIIELKAGKANKDYYMVGWEGFEQWPVKVDYEPSLNSLFFSSQLIAEDTQITDTQRGAIYLLAGEESGNFYSNDEGDYEIAIAGILDDGMRAIVRYGVNMPNYPKFTQMFYMAKIGDKYYSLTEESKIPTFISAMTPGARPKAFSIGKNNSALRNKFAQLKTAKRSRVKLTLLHRQ